MKEKFWQKIKEHKLFIILVILILILLIIKITSQNGQKNNSTTINAPIIDSGKNSTINEITSTPTPTEVKPSQEEIQKMSYEDFWNDTQNLTKKEQENLPVMDFYVNGSLPHEESEFLAKKCEGGKIYAKAKIEDKVKASGALKYWYYIEIGTTLSNDNIIWE